MKARLEIHYPNPAMRKEIEIEILEGKTVLGTMASFHEKYDEIIESISQQVSPGTKIYLIIQSKSNGNRTKNIGIHEFP